MRLRGDVLVGTEQRSKNLPNPAGTRAAAIGIRVLAVANQKGGVAKSATALNTAAALAALGERVLAIDLDPQANLSLGLGVTAARFERGTAELFESESVGLDAAVTATSVPGLDLVASDMSLSQVEWDMWRTHHPDHLAILRRKLVGTGGRWTYVVMDTPPSLGLFTINALSAADRVLVPVAPEPFSLIGLQYLLRVVDDIRFRDNHHLRLLGYVRSLWEDRSRLARQIDAQLVEMKVGRVMETIIRSNVRIKEAMVAGQPVTIYDPASSGAQAYGALAEEVGSRW